MFKFMCSFFKVEDYKMSTQSLVHYTMNVLTKVKVLFQGLHMTHVIFMLVYNFIFYIWIPFFTLNFKYKYKYTLITS
jgi:hypothetical protein